MFVNKAVIPAAGLGSRLSRITRATPKELIPLVDRPAIDWVIEESIESGVDRICVVTAPRKLEALRAHLSDVDADITFLLQTHALGLGHAVSIARQWCGDDPFAVVLPDDLFLGDAVLSRLANHTEVTETSCLSLTELPEPLLSRYGVAAIEPLAAGGYAVNGLVEKPALGEAPSLYTVSGRYVLTPEIWPHLERATPGHNGEIQLTDALAAMARDGRLHGLPTFGERHDLGSPQSWLAANIAYARELYGKDWNTKTH